MSNFGEAFVNAYNTTSATVENRKRTALLESAEARNKEKHDLEMKEAQEAFDATHAIADKVQTKTAQMDNWVKSSMPPPTPAQGLQPPPGAAPVTPPPDQGDTYSGPMRPDAYSGPVRTAAIANAPPPPVAAAPSPAPSAPLPGAPPPGAAPTPAPGGAPPPSPTDMGPPAAAAGPEGAIPEAVPPGPSRRSPPTYNDFINHARDLVNDITPDIIRMLAKSNPTEAAKYAVLGANAPLQDRMTKIAALGMITKANSADPAIPALIQEVIPNAVPGSWKPHPPDPKGNNGYGQFTVKMPDGSTAEYAMNPATIDQLLTTTLSPTGFLEHGEKAKETERKAKETDAQIQNWEESKKLAWAEHQRHVDEFKELAPDRHALAQAHLASAGANAEMRLNAIEERTTAREQKASAGVTKAVYETLGLTPAALQDEEKVKAAVNTRAFVDSLARGNNIKLDPGLASQLTVAATNIQQGKNVYRDKNGDYYYNTGDPKNPLKINPQLLPGAPQAPARGLTK